MLETITQTGKTKYFMTYAASFLGYGCLLVILGPLIPYLSAKTQIIETEYSFLFGSRAWGMTLGSLFMTYIQSKPKKPSLHQFLIISSVIIVITNLLFIWATTPFQQGVWVFIGSMGNFILQITVNISIITLSGKNNPEYGLLFIGGMFGLGGLMAPVLVYLFEMNSYYVITAIIELTVPAYLFLNSPQSLTYQRKLLELETNKLNSRQQYLLSFLLFTFLGTVAAVSAWSSSYSVITGISTKEEATVFPIIFMFTMTTGRFIFPLLKIKTSQKLNYSIIGVFLSALLSVIILEMGFKKEALIFNCFTLGIFMSSIYAFIFSISSQFSQPLTSKQASSIAFWGVIGCGVITPLCGKLIEWINPNMFFYLILILYVLMFIANKMTMAGFHHKTPHQKLEMEMNILTATSLMG